MTAMPNMTVLEPSDGTQVKKMMKSSLEWNGPIYMRVSVVPAYDIYDEDYNFEIGKASIPFDGNDGAIICSGVVVQYAIEAAEEIYEEIRKRIRVVDMHTIKPVDKEAIREASKTGCILVVQDHNVIGGLGSIVSTIIASEGLKTKFRIAGVEDRFVPMARPDYLYKQFGYDKEGIKKKMLMMLEETCE
jgi:transketolase